MSSKAESRLLHYDVLRIIAAFSVVMLHSSAQFWYMIPVTEPNWLITNGYDAISRFGVPVFVAISGALFLNPEREVNIKRLFTHNILRLVILYGVWSAVYGMYSCGMYDGSQVDFKIYIKAMIQGRYHLWFIPMIAGIYCLVPILHSWVKKSEQKNIEYFLGLFLVFKVGIFTLKAVVWQDELHQLLDLVDIPMVCGYVGYFVLGYYIAHIGIAKKYHPWVYAAGGISSVCNVVISTALSQKKGSPLGEVFDSFGFFTFCMVVAILLFFMEKKDGFCISDLGAKIIREVSACTFGVYVMHVGLMEYLMIRGIQPANMPMLIGVPVFAVACFVICLTAAAILRRIPLIGKYIC